MLVEILLSGIVDKKRELAECIDTIQWLIQKARYSLIIVNVYTCDVSIDSHEPYRMTMLSRCHISTRLNHHA
jgi:hypothetical protein